MAEYIRFRLTSAKLGVTMALAALIGGVADRAQAQSAAPGKPAPLFVNRNPERPLVLGCPGIFKPGKPKSDIGV